MTYDQFDDALAKMWSMNKLDQPDAILIPTSIFDLMQKVSDLVRTQRFRRMSDRRQKKARKALLLHDAG